MEYNGRSTHHLVLAGEDVGAVADRIAASEPSVRVDATTSTDRAVELVTDGDVDCVVTDGSVPGGWPALSAALDRLESPPPVVLCDAPVDDADRELTVDVAAYVPLPLEASNAGTIVEHVRAVTAREHRERLLRELQTATQDLFRAETPSAIADRTVAAAKSVLGHPLTTVFALDEGDGEFRPVSTTEDRAAFGERPAPIPLENSLSGDAYQSGEPVVFGDETVPPSVRGSLEDVRARNTDESPVLSAPDNEMRSGIILPLDDFGVLGVVSTDRAAFEPADVQFLSVLAESASAAFDRAARERTLERNNRQLETFAAIVSHDLRNPLTVASGRLELLAERIDDPDLDHARGALGRMDEIIDDVLTLVRTDRLDDLEEVALASVVEEAWTTVETDGARLSIDGDLGTVRADRSHLRELLENVVDNAVSHGGSGVTVRVGRLEDGGFFVEDDGPGVPPDERETIFEYGHTTVPAGTGLGLAIVERVANAHGWAIEAVESSRGGLRLEFSAGSDR